MNLIKSRHEKFYLISVFLCEFGRTLPHAILTLILINKGIKLEEIAIIQIFYMLAIIVCELPSGVMSDVLDRKYIYLASVLMITISYTMIYYLNSFPSLCLSWFVYGISSALESGTLDVSFTNLYKDNSKKLKGFISKVNIALSIAAIFGGYLGSLFYTEINTGIYIIAVVLYVLSALLVFIFIPSDKGYNKNEENPKLRSYAKVFISNVLEMVKSKKMIELFLLISMTQLFVQPFFQYWQALFLEHSIPEFTFGFMYVLFRCINILASFILVKIEHSYRSSIILLTLAFFCLWVGEIINFQYIHLIIAPFMLLLVSVYMLNLECCLRETVDTKVMGTIISVTGTIGRFFSTLVLLLTSFILKIFSVSAMFVIINSVFFVSAVGMNLHFQRNRKTSLYS